MAESQTPKTITPWFELLGEVESLTGNEVIVLSRKKHRVKLSDEAIASHRHLLQPGVFIAVLVLDDGTVRIREPRKKPKKRSMGALVSCKPEGVSQCAPPPPEFNLGYKAAKPKVKVCLEPEAKP